MNSLIKRSLFALLTVVLVGLLNLTIFAAEVNVDDSFYVYGGQTDKVCEVLGVEENALKSYCEQNNVTFLAVDKENKRQIKAFCFETDFANSIINISSMNDDNISQLVPEIVGMENVKGDVIISGKQKFIKTAVITEDSGGEYVLISFTTVANRKNYVLNFYTLKGEDTDYIDGIFEDYAKSTEFSGGKGQNFNFYRILIFIGVVVFITAFVMIGLSVIKDLRNKNEEAEDMEIQEENTETESESEEEIQVEQTQDIEAKTEEIKEENEESEE